MTIELPREDVKLLLLMASAMREAQEQIPEACPAWQVDRMARSLEEALREPH